MAETPMRERMARAACRVSCTACPENGTCWDWKPTLPEIDAILVELERPSEGMVEAGVRFDADDPAPTMRTIFGAMIRAAREGK